MRWIRSGWALQIERRRLGRGSRCSACPRRPFAMRRRWLQRSLPSLTTRNESVSSIDRETRKAHIVILAGSPPNFAMLALIQRRAARSTMRKKSQRRRSQACEVRRTILKSQVSNSLRVDFRSGKESESIQSVVECDVDDGRAVGDGSEDDGSSVIRSIASEFKSSTVDPLSRRRRQKRTKEGGRRGKKKEEGKEEEQSVIVDENKGMKLTTRTGRFVADAGAMTLTERQSSDSGALLRADSLKKGCALMSFCKIEACPPAVPDVEDCCEHCWTVKIPSAECPTTNCNQAHRRSKFSGIERLARGTECSGSLES